MSTPTIEFLFDFGSPNAYLCHKVIPALEGRLGTRVHYQPVLLGGLFKLANNRSPVEAYGAIPNKLAYQRLEMQRFIRKHRLDAYRHNPHFPVNTLKIMRGAVAAQGLGVFEAYVDAVYAAMWEHGQDMAQDDVISRVLQAAGLDAAALLAASQQPEVKAALVANTEAAHARGAFGSPSFFVGEELYFGKDRLREVEESFLDQRGEG
jgi:2-hydroxychromene-2-carboxylate isomerase